MARHVPSQAGNKTSEVFETLFVSFPGLSIATVLCILVLARSVQPSRALVVSHMMLDRGGVES